MSNVTKPMECWEGLIGRVFRTDNVSEAWEHWYGELEEMGSGGFLDPSRDGDVVGELLNTVTIISDPRNNIVKSELRGLNLRYMIGELLWYNSANNSLKGIQNYTSAWDRMSDDGEIVNSNYGHKIHKFYGFDQWDYIREMLKNNPESRQAVIHIKNPSAAKSKDVPCTISLQFLIRNGLLHMTVYMRSNDIWMGFPYDVFNFTCMQIQMAMELEVGIGSYTHIAGSMHLYKRNSSLKDTTCFDAPKKTPWNSDSNWLSDSDKAPEPGFDYSDYLKRRFKEGAEND